MSIVYKRDLKRQVKNRKTNEKRQFMKDIKNAVKWNLPRLEHDTITMENVSREMAVKLLRLNKVAPKTDPDGKHAMQTLISLGYVLRPRRYLGQEYFRRDDLLQSLKAYVGRDYAGETETGNRGNRRHGYHHNHVAAGVRHA